MDKTPEGNCFVDTDSITIREAPDHLLLHSLWPDDGVINRITDDTDAVISVTDDGGELLRGTSPHLSRDSGVGRKPRARFAVLALDYNYKEIMDRHNGTISVELS